MHIVLVHIHVKPENLDAFITATIENASNSIKEPGIVRFDFIQQSDEPTHFTLIEVYREADAQAKHRETVHYLKWRDTVVDWMAEPRSGIKYANIFPNDSGW